MSSIEPGRGMKIVAAAHVMAEKQKKKEQEKARNGRNRGSPVLAAKKRP